MIFQNSPVSVSALPQVEEIDYRPLAPAYRRVELIGTAFLFGVLFLGWVVFYLFSQMEEQWPVWAALAVWVALFSFSMFLAWKRWEVAGYVLRDRDILHKKGIIFRTVTAIPFSRMQHCELSQGPIESAFGIATISIFTAGGSSSDLRLEGLQIVEAQRIREFITGKISERQEEEL